MRTKYLYRINKNVFSEIAFRRAAGMSLEVVVRDSFLGEFALTEDCEISVLDQQLNNALHGAAVTERWIPTCLTQLCDLVIGELNASRARSDKPSPGNMMLNSAKEEESV